MGHQDRRGHEHDSIDQFGMPEIGHGFPTAEELGGVHAVALP